MKTCSRCSESKEYSLFSKKNASSDGYKSHCKSCEKIDRINNAARDKIRKKDWLLKNKERVRAVQKLYDNKNKERLLLKRREYRRAYELNKLKTDINHRLKNRLRARLHSAIKNKSTNTIDGLGCSIEQLKIHLESKFQPGMTWDNWSKSGWHIDHIIPLSYFDLTNEEQLAKACHYTNLQPLWAADNLSKKCKIQQ